MSSEVTSKDICQIIASMPKNKGLDLSYVDAGAYFALPMIGENIGIDWEHTADKKQLEHLGEEILHWEERLPQLCDELYHGDDSLSERDEELLRRLYLDPNCAWHEDYDRYDTEVNHKDSKDFCTKQQLRDIAGADQIPADLTVDDIYDPKCHASHSSALKKALLGVALKNTMNCLDFLSWDLNKMLVHERNAGVSAEVDAGKTEKEEQTQDLKQVKPSGIHH